MDFYHSTKTNKPSNAAVMHWKPATWGDSGFLLCFIKYSQLEKYCLITIGIGFSAHCGPAVDPGWILLLIMPKKFSQKT